MSYESAKCECCRRRRGVRSVCGIWCCATCAEAETELERMRAAVPPHLDRLFRREPRRAD